MKTNGAPRHSPGYDEFSQIAFEEHRRETSVMVSIRGFRSAGLCS